MQGTHPTPAVTKGEYIKNIYDLSVWDYNSNSGDILLTRDFFMGNWYEADSTKYDHIATLSLVKFIPYETKGKYALSRHLSGFSGEGLELYYNLSKFSPEPTGLLCVNNINSDSDTYVKDLSSYANNYCGSNPWNNTLSIYLRLTTTVKLCDGRCSAPTPKPTLPGKCIANCSNEPNCPKDDVCGLLTTSSECSQTYLNRSMSTGYYSKGSAWHEISKNSVDPLECMSSIMPKQSSTDVYPYGCGPTELSLHATACKWVNPTPAPKPTPKPVCTSTCKPNGCGISHYGCCNDNECFVGSYDCATGPDKGKAVCHIPPEGGTGSCRCKTPEG